MDNFETEIKLSSLGDIEDAQNHLKIIIQENPTNAVAWHWYINTLQKKESRVRALKYYQKFHPNSIWAKKALDKLQVDGEGLIQRKQDFEISVKNCPNCSKKNISYGIQCAWCCSPLVTDYQEMTSEDDTHTSVAKIEDHMHTMSSKVSETKAIYHGIVELILLLTFIVGFILIARIIISGFPDGGLLSVLLVGFSLIVVFKLLIDIGELLPWKRKSIRLDERTSKTQTRKRIPNSLLNSQRRINDTGNNNKKIRTDVILIACLAFIIVFSYFRSQSNIGSNSYKPNGNDAFSYAIGYADEQLGVSPSFGCNNTPEWYKVNVKDLGYATFHAKGSVVSADKYCIKEVRDFEVVVQYNNQSKRYEIIGIVDFSAPYKWSHDWKPGSQ